MIAVTKIFLDRVEGQRDQITVSNWSNANAVISRWRHTAPMAGHGYDKTDFVITFEDGEVYEGRIDLNRDRFEPLEAHVYNFCRLYAGVWKPGWMDQDHYNALMEMTRPETKAACKNYLVNYDLGLENLTFSKKDLYHA